MFNKKIVSTVLNTVCLFCLTSWDLPMLSRSQQVPQDYEDKIKKMQELKKEERKIRKEQKEAVREQYQFAYLAHQKNRLVYFADRDGFIWFDDKDNKYTFFLSNFYPVKIKIWNMKFACAEGAFQAAKFLHKPELAVRFTNLSGEEAWKLAQKMSYQQRDDWYKVRESLMLEVLYAKFDQHSDLKELLLATGDAYLVQTSDRNAFWADGGDGTGKNRLGNLLMQVRSEKGGIGVVPKPKKYKKFALDD